MKKWPIAVAILIVVIVGILLILPYFVGRNVEKKYTQILRSLPAASNTKVTLLSYQRGWFSSDARIQVSMRFPWLAGVKQMQSQIQPVVTVTGPETLILRQHIQHGPIIFAAAQSEYSRVVIGQALTTSSIKQPDIDIASDMLIKLNGDISTVVNATRLTFTNKQQQRNFFVNGLHANTLVSANLHKISGNSQLQTVGLDFGNQQQRIQGIAFQFETAKGNDGLWMGHQSLQIEKVILNLPTAGKDKRSIVVDGIGADVRNDRDKDKVNSQLQVAVKNVAYNGKDYGPHQLNFTIKGIDVGILARLNKTAEALQGEGKPAPMQIIQLFQNLTALLGKGLTVELNKLNIVTSWGLFAMNSEVIVQPQQGPITTGSLLDKLTVTVDAKIPAGLLQFALQTSYQESQKASAKTLQQLPVPADSGSEKPAVAQKTAPASDPKEIAEQRIKAWLQAGKITADGDDYKIHAVYKNRQLLVNGKPVTLAPGGKGNALINPLSAVAQ